MLKKYKELIISVVIAIGLLTIYNLYIRDPDIYFARSVFENLVRANQGAQDVIEWSLFKGVGFDVGANYLRLPDELQRKTFRKVFITSFSEGFRKTEGKLGAFVNWRISSKDDKTMTVAADYKTHGKTLLFTFIRQPRKLISVEWEGVTAQNEKTQ